MRRNPVFFRKKAHFTAYVSWVSSLTPWGARNNTNKSMNARQNIEVNVVEINPRVDVDGNEEMDKNLNKSNIHFNNISSFLRKEIGGSNVVINQFNNSGNKDRLKTEQKKENNVKAYINKFNNNDCLSFGKCDLKQPVLSQHVLTVKPFEAILKDKEMSLSKDCSSNLNPVGTNSRPNSEDVYNSLSDSSWDDSIVSDPHYTTATVESHCDHSRNKIYKPKDIVNQTKQFMNKALKSFSQLGTSSEISSQNDTNSNEALKLEIKNTGLTFTTNPQVQKLLNTKHVT